MLIQYNYKELSLRVEKCSIIKSMSQKELEFTYHKLRYRKEMLLFNIILLESNIDINL